MGNDRKGLTYFTTLNNRKAYLAPVKEPNLYSIFFLDVNRVIFNPPEIIVQVWFGLLGFMAYQTL